jgi:hypothetical protein
MRTQRAGFVLVGAVVLGQLSRVLFEALRHADFLTSGKPPLLGVLGLAVALVWCGVIIWARLRIGQDLNGWARGWFAGFAVDDTVPRRYVIADRGSLLAAALCAIIDLVLLLVMQGTVRAPLLIVTSGYTSPAWADGAFVLVVVILALLVLSHMYQTSKPVAAYLAWSVMDRLVPTAGFLATPTAPALARARTGSQPALDQPANSNEPASAATVPQDSAPQGSSAATVPQAAPQEATVVAEKKPEAPVLADELTVRAPSVDPEQTSVSERTVVADKHSDTKGDQL